jgi:hypothetical protein
VAALAAAAYPTWDVHRAEYGAYYVRGCVGLFGGYGFGLAELASPLLGDAFDLAGLAVQWSVPAILVLAGLLMSATTGSAAVAAAVPEKPPSSEAAVGTAAATDARLKNVRRLVGLVSADSVVMCCPCEHWP